MIGIALAMTLQLGAQAGDPELDRYGPLPAEVRVLIDRRADCNHWAGEEPYDRDRKREIQRAIRDLRCETVPREETRLRRRYAKLPQVLLALADTRDWQ
jgi:hypothetical protein